MEVRWNHSPTFITYLHIVSARLVVMCRVDSILIMLHSTRGTMTPGDYTSYTMSDGVTLSSHISSSPFPRVSFSCSLFTALSSHDLNSNKPRPVHQLTPVIMHNSSLLTLYHVYDACSYYHVFTPTVTHSPTSNQSTVYNHEHISLLEHQTSWTSLSYLQFHLHSLTLVIPSSIPFQKSI